MSVIHPATLTPTKLELLATWRTGQPWYAPTGSEPELARAGGFRLNDPAGAGGIEFMVGPECCGHRWIYDGVHDPVLQDQPLPSAGLAGPWRQPGGGTVRGRFATARRDAATGRSTSR